MMRARLASLALLATCGSCGLLTLGGAQAGGAPKAWRAHPAAAATRTEWAHPAAAATGAFSGERVWQLSLAPAPDDLALAEIRFRGPSSQRLSAGSVQLAVSGVEGDGYDYLAMATPRFSTPGGARAFVLLVNRPSTLQDPAVVRLRLSAQRALGQPRSLTLANPFTHPAVTHRPALCNLPLHGHALRGARLSTLRSRGARLQGFSVAEALAQAYDVACGLSYTSAFRQAVTHPLVPPMLASPSPAPPSPAPPAPTPPVTPTPGPPGCAPCDAPPMFACPLALHPHVCIASAAGAGRRA